MVDAGQTGRAETGSSDARDPCRMEKHKLNSGINVEQLLGEKEGADPETQQLPGHFETFQITERSVFTLLFPHKCSV